MTRTPRATQKPNNNAYSWPVLCLFVHAAKPGLGRNSEALKAPSLRSPFEQLPPGICLPAPGPNIEGAGPGTPPSVTVTQPACPRTVGGGGGVAPEIPSTSPARLSGRVGSGALPAPFSFLSPPSPCLSPPPLPFLPYMSPLSSPVLRHPMVPWSRRGEPPPAGI